jgi:hypothetical protein
LVTILFSYLLFLSNINHLTSPDTDPAKYTVYSLYFNHDFDLNEFYEDPLIDSEKQPNFTPPTNSLWGKRTDYITKKIYWINPSVFIPINSKMYGHFPIGPSIYQTIFVFTLKLLQFPILSEKQLFEFSESKGLFYSINFKIGEPLQLERISSSIVACLILISFYFLLKELNLNSHILYLLIYAFCTSLFTIESQALWQHGFIELFSIISLISIYKYINSNRKYYLFLLGFFLTLNFYFRPTSLLISGFIYFFFLIFNYQHFKKFKIFSLETLIGAIIVIIIFSIINLSIYHHLGGGYFIALKDPLHEGIKFDVNGYLERLYYLIFTPSRGLIFFFPYFIFIFFSLKDKKLFVLKVLCISIIVIYHLFYAFFTIWTAGFSYGNRFFAELNPFFMILILFAYQTSNVRFKKAFYFLVLISFLIQLHGAYWYEHTTWLCKAGYSEEKLTKSWKHMQQLFFIEQIKPWINKEIYYPPEECCILNFTKKNSNFYIDYNNETQNKKFIFFVLNKYLPKQSCLTFYFNDFTEKIPLFFNVNNQSTKIIISKEVQVQIENPKLKKILLNIYSDSKNSFFQFNGYKISKDSCSKNYSKIILD